jgi:glucokinase
MHLGIDLGGTNLKVGVLNSDGELVYKDSLPTLATNGVDYVIGNITKLIESTIEKFKTQTIGIGVPGVITNGGVVTIAPNLDGWVDIPIKNILQKEFLMPVSVDNDANAAAIAELELGAGKDIDNFIFLTLGTGVGGAIIANRKLFRGEDGGAGEIGHIILNCFDNSHDNLIGYRKGTLEEYIGRTQIISNFKRIQTNHTDNNSVIDTNYDVEDISNAINNGDDSAKECFIEVGEYLGIGLTTVMNLLDIKTTIIGGGISNAHTILLETALGTLKKRSLPSIAKNAKILKATFSNDAGIIGAALLGKYK